MDRRPNAERFRDWATNVLAQLALIVFALCAVLALIVDIGYARMTQAQMQNAADAAALEGVLRRDPATGQPDRAAARGLVSLVFDDDFDPTNGDPHQFGAGPIINLTEGATELHALQTMSVPDVRVYKPDLQLNPDNAVHGDLVSGSFSYSADPGPSEDATYARSDFDPGVAVSDNAFLVRLRRSNEFRDVDGQVELDVASSGPSLPLLFGKASTIRGDDPSSTYSPRRDGFTVRATAIAATRPALRVGLPQPLATPPMPGVTPFALADTFVQTLNAAVPPSCAVANLPAGCVTINPANGLVFRSSDCLASPLTCAGVNPALAIGGFADNLTDPTRSRWALISTVGRCLVGCPPGETSLPPVALAGGGCGSANFVSQYGPVYSVMSSGATRIIGFARISLSQDPTRATNPCAKRASRAASAVASSNATASLMNGLALSNAQPDEITELLQRNAAVAYGPVLVPVLVR